MRHVPAVLALVLAACGGAGDSAGPDDPTPGGNPPAPAPPGPLPAIGGCQIFPADNAWNRDVSGDPVHPSSAALLAEMMPDSSLHLDLGTSEEYYGIPYTVVPADQPLVPITFGTDGADYSDESDPGPMPIPLNVHIEGGSSAEPDPASGDRHVLVVRQGDCMLYELYNTERTGDGFRVSSSAIWDLTLESHPACRLDLGRRRRAADPSRPPQIRRGGEDRLHHALRFTIPQVRRAYIAPASHCGQYADDALPPYGTRVRLKADFSLEGYRGDALVVLTAMKRYGLILADQGSAWYVTGTSDPGWEDALDQLRALSVRGSDFEVVASGPVTAC